MNFLFDIGHPGHVHLFRNLSDILRDHGHNVYFTVKKRQNITRLLVVYNIDYISLGKKYDSLVLKYFTTIIHLVKMFFLVKSKKIDLGIGVSGLLAIVSKFTSMDSICLDDDDSLATPLFAKSIMTANTICTPAALKNDPRGPQHITYEGYHELAYLHPNQFIPNPNVIKDLGLTEGDTFFILRFNAFRAHHDGGESGMIREQKQRLIQLLLPYGRVFISSEKESPEFKKYKLNIKSHQIHSALYYAKMFVGDSQTMCSEAAVLGTPALKCNSFAKRLSIPNELEDKYGLCYAYRTTEFDAMLDKARQLLNNQTLKEDFQFRRQNMLSEKIDVTAFMAWFIENYPNSLQRMKDEPGFHPQ